MTILSRRSLLAGAVGGAALLAVNACAAPPALTGGESSAVGPNAALAGVAATAFATSGLAGCAMRVRHDGALWRGSFGVADLSTKEPYRSADNVRIASLTKTFTATAILRMIDDGLLAFDTTLDRFFPTVPNASTITIEQMLAMRSGIYNFTNEKAFDDAFDANPTMSWDIQDTLDFITRNTPDFAPGAEVQYCDSNYALFGAIAEKVDNVALSDVI